MARAFLQKAAYVGHEALEALTREAGDLRDLGGVSQDTGEGRFEHVEDGAPAFPSPRPRASPERQKLGRGGAEGGTCWARSTPGPGTRTHTVTVFS